MVSTATSGRFRTVKINPNEVNDLYLVDTWNAPSL